MTTRIPTLKDLFVPADGMGTHAPRSDGDLPDAPAVLASVLNPFQWKGVCGKVPDLLDVSVADVLLGGWRKCAEVRRSMRASRADPGRTILVHLGAHTLTSTHRPTIAIRYDGRDLVDLVFPIALEFEIEAAELTIRGGRAVEARTGEVRVKGEVRLENTVLYQRQTSPLRLPGRMALAEPASAPVPHRTNAIPNGLSPTASVPASSSAPSGPSAW
jgi:hypothetical protein